VEFLKHNHTKFFLIIFFIFFAGYLFIQNFNFRITEEKLSLGTIVQVDVCTSLGGIKKARHAIQKVWQRIDEINLRMNVYSEESDVAKINKSYPSPIKIHQDTYLLLDDAKKYSVLTGGAFDITVGPLVLLWKKASRVEIMPSEMEIQEAKEKIGSHRFELLDKNTVVMLHPGTRIDLSAVAKGYAVDQAAEILRNNGINNFLINAGGNIFAQGKNCQKKLWSVGVQNPIESKMLVDRIDLENLGVATSGDYQQHFVIEDEQYSHVIDPRSGYPVRLVTSATVVAKTAQEADAFSTALCVMGSDRGIYWADHLQGDISAMIIERKKNGEIVQHISEKYKDLHKASH